MTDRETGIARRRVLASLAAAGALSGCLGGVPGVPGSGSEPSDGEGGSDRPTSDGSDVVPGDGTRSGGASAGSGSDSPGSGTGQSSGTTEQLPLARHGSPSTICEESVNERSGIDAIVDPAFDADWSGYEVGGEYSLDDGDVVVGLDRDGTTRAYPISVLYHHEIANDVLDVPTMVTYCPLCNSGMVADRRVDGRPLEFLVSGLLWQPPGVETAIREESDEVFGVGGRDTDREVINRGNLVMYDRETRSFWSQMLATGICGPHRGTELRILPSTTATWADWRDAHPDTEVLLPPPHSTTNASG